MKDKSITRFLGDIKPIKNYERYYVSKLGHVFTIGRTYGYVQGVLLQSCCKKWE